MHIGAQLTAKCAANQPTNVSWPKTHLFWNPIHHSCLQLLWSWISSVCRTFSQPVYLKELFTPSLVEIPGMSWRLFITCSFVGEGIHDEETKMNVNNTA